VADSQGRKTKRHGVTGQSGATDQVTGGVVTGKSGAPDQMTGGDRTFKSAKTEVKG
jgi:hypothetical protein